MKRSSGSSHCSALEIGQKLRIGRLGRVDATTHPNMRSGCAMKSVMRSSMLLGSRTKVGNVTLWRSMPTLSVDRESAMLWQGHGSTHRSCEMRDRMIEPSSSSLWGVIVSTVVDI